ncbi:MAG: DNA repair protein RecO [Oligoflexia bacterium]
MRLITDRAIVLRVVAFEDRHRVVTALSENYGKISALARNSVQSRRFGGALEIFTAAEWKVSERSDQAELWSLQEARAIRAYEGLRSDLGLMAMAGVFSELMIRVAPEKEACPDLFKLHANGLAALEDLFKGSASQPPTSFLNGYLAKLLQWSGSQPSLSACRGCSRKLQDYWSSGVMDAPLWVLVADAGWVCQVCKQGAVSEMDGPQVTSGAMADFYMSLVTPIRQIPSTAQSSEQEHRSLFRVLEALLIYHLPGFDRIPMKSLKFLGLGSTWQPPSDHVR